MFKPLLAPNESIDLDSLSYPMIASTKIDGIRMIVKDGDLITRSLKPIMSTPLLRRFWFLAQYARDNKLIFDGELYSPSLTFPELSGQCRAYDADIADDLCFYCFDCLIEPAEKNCQRAYHLRINEINYHARQLQNKYFKTVLTRNLSGKEEVETFFEEALAEGFEGLILRNPDKGYKFGRATVKENIIYKVKPFVTLDAQIIGVIQSTEVREGAEKKVNELGRSVTSKKQADRVLIDKASAFAVLYEGKELKVTLAMTDEEKEEVWKNQKKYIGRWVEYKGMLVGSKDVPRHPVYIRMRPDKD